jgi:hypothetical protein
MDRPREIQVIELPEFEAAARKLLSNEERKGLVEYLASRPETGDVIPGTGGVRKVRWRSRGKGKRGGARVIYFFFARQGHVYLLTAYGKSQKDDLTAQEKKLWKEVVEKITARQTE